VRAREVKQIAEGHLRRIEAKIVEIEAVKRTLGELVASCRGDHRPYCPILEDLAGEPVAAA
jgi:MerR family transcriptional regulator, copper efflux regulator